MRLFPPRPFNKNSPHRLGRGGKEVPAAIPVLCFVAIYKAKIGFMYQRCSLQRLARFLVRKPRRRKFAKLVVYKGQQLFARRRIARLDLQQDLRGISHDSGRLRFSALYLNKPRRDLPSRRFFQRVEAQVVGPLSTAAKIDGTPISLL